MVVSFPNSWSFLSNSNHYQHFFLLPLWPIRNVHTFSWHPQPRWFGYYRFFIFFLVTSVKSWCFLERLGYAAYIIVYVSSLEYRELSLDYGTLVLHRFFGCLIGQRCRTRSSTRRDQSTTIGSLDCVLGLYELWGLQPIWVLV